ncbi:uncharacterized protein [Antedon mediterranea]|uniref:uncharacterized protein n=1 Tax=Antedon mediterranea TaxID=105859 RepID=UPI003AF59F8C
MFVMFQDGASPLYLAAQNGHTDVCTILLKAGAKFDLPRNDGWTPLHSAAINGHTDICTILLKAGANLDLTTNHRSTPLNLAAQNGHTDVCTILLKAGDKLDLPDNDGETPLMCAAAFGHVRTCMYLIKVGADVNHLNHYGKSVIDLYNENECKKYDNELRAGQKAEIIDILKGGPLPDIDIETPDLDIPYVITARGKLVEKTYIEALTEGKIEVNLGILKVIGQEGVGKTCLVNACLGKEFNVNHEITDGVAVIKTIETNAELNKWDKNDESDNPNSLYRKLAEENINKRIEGKEDVEVEELASPASCENVRTIYNRNNDIFTY